MGDERLTDMEPRDSLAPIKAFHDISHQANIKSLTEDNAKLPYFLWLLD